MIIDRFIDLNIVDFNKIKQLKEIINKFEQFKRDLNRKISLAFSNTNTVAADAGSFETAGD